MNEVKIIIDDNEADFESSESLPLQLSKKTDNFFAIPGTEGMEIDNELNEISLPATKNNHRIYRQIALSHMMPGSAVLSKDTKIIANGLQIFSGSSILKNASVNTLPDSFSLELIGDSLVIWSELEGVGLRDLDMGVQTWNATFVKNSWTGTYDTAWKGVFAPILYGKTSGVLYPGSWHERDFRFSVYFRSIVDAIFIDLLGYSLVSTFFDTDFFKECVYAFGVGEDVKIEGIGLSTRVVVYRPEDSVLDTNPIEFDNVYVNTFSEWNPLATFTADGNGDYTFEIFGSGVGWTTLEIKKNGGVIFSTGPTSTIGSTNIFQVLETFTLLASDDITITSNTATLNSVEMQISLPQLPWGGGDIVVSSCLHDIECKDFIRAISHMFNLAWRVNNTTKQVFVEPRLPYVLYESGTPVNYQGFYQRATDTSTLKSHSALSNDLSLEYPFGKSVIFAYKDNGSDPVFEAYQNANTEPLVPIFGVRKDFTVSHGDKREMLNPLFVPLLLTIPDGYDANGTYGIPTILPDSYEISEDHMPSYAEGDIKYKGNPTCGILIRGDLSAYYDDTNTFEDMPRLIQNRPFETAANPDVMTLLSFADTTMLNPLTQVETINPGLVSTFYKQYLQMANPASVFTIRESPSLTNFAAEEFHDLKILQLNNEWFLAILLEIGEMNPVTLRLVKNVLLKWVEATDSEESSITNNDSTIHPVPRPST